MHPNESPFAWAILAISSASVVAGASSTGRAAGFGIEGEAETCSTSVLQRLKRHHHSHHVVEELDNFSTRVFRGYGNTRLLGGFPQNLSNTSWIHLHIPKCAGSSVVYNLHGTTDRSAVLPADDGFFSSQDCIPSVHNLTEIIKLNGTKRYVMLLREPRSHVQSLFSYCLESDWAQSRSNDSEFGSVFTNLTSWLTYHDDGLYDRSGATFGCYSPLNYQARHLTCSGSGIEIDPLRDTAPDAEEAVDAMTAVDIVGIVERYQESICLVAAKVDMAALPCYCNCEDEAAWATFPELDETQSRHNMTTKHSTAELSSHDIEMIDRLNAVDTALYEAAVQRFLADMDAAEQKHGVRILCDRDIIK